MEKKIKIDVNVEAIQPNEEALIKKMDRNK